VLLDAVNITVGCHGCVYRTLIVTFVNAMDPHFIGSGVWGGQPQFQKKCCPKVAAASKKIVVAWLVSTL
jgi:hypothetical protein